MRIITDFDGPIMDISDRYYHVYKICLETVKYHQQSVFQLPKEKFWELKRAKIKEKDIGIISGLDEQQALKFAQKRQEIVHNLSYLIYDKTVPGAIATLENWQKKGIDLVVMTMRLSKELKFALKQENLTHFFPENKRYCLANDYIKIADIQDKPILMGKALQQLEPVEETWVIGDTEADIIAAKTHKIKVIAILSGIRDRTQLEKYEPDHIVQDLTEAAELIQS
jgi:phosphoglycolate phosphatase-like HAD superfamily hydrolase